MSETNCEDCRRHKAADEALMMALRGCLPQNAFKTCQAVADALRIRWAPDELVKIDDLIDEEMKEPDDDPS